MADLNRVLMFALSDALGMQLQYDPASRFVEGKQERQVNMHGLRLTVPMTIVSSRLASNCYMLMARVFGNLGLFVVREAGGEPRHRRSPRPEPRQDGQAGRLAGEARARVRSRGRRGAEAGDRQKLCQEQAEQLGGPMTTFTQKYIAYRDWVLNKAKQHRVEPTAQELAMLYVAGVSHEAALEHWLLGRRFVEQANEEEGKT